MFPTDVTECTADVFDIFPPETLPSTADYGTGANKQILMLWEKLILVLALILREMMLMLCRRRLRLVLMFSEMMLMLILVLPEMMLMLILVPLEMMLI